MGQQPLSENSIRMLAFITKWYACCVFLQPDVLFPGRNLLDDASYIINRKNLRSLLNFSSRRYVNYNKSFPPSKGDIGCVLNKRSSKQLELH